MKSIDKNDVDLSKLYNWGKKVILLSPAQEPIYTFYLRLVGDADLNKARVRALRKSAEMRKKLREEDSDERLAFIPIFDLIEKPNLVEAILAKEVRSITLDVVRNLDYNLPVEPKSDAPLEEFEKHQEIIDDWPKNRNEKITQEVTKRLEIERKRLTKLPKKELDELYERVLIDNICEDIMSNTFQETCVYYGIYLDENYTEKAFDSFEDFDNILPYFKEQLIDIYRDIDMGLDDLKK